MPLNVALRIRVGIGLLLVFGVQEAHVHTAAPEPLQQHKTLHRTAQFFPPALRSCQ